MGNKLKMGTGYIIMLVRKGCCFLKLDTIFLSSNVQLTLALI